MLEVISALGLAACSSARSPSAAASCMHAVCLQLLLQQAHVIPGSCNQWQSSFRRNYASDSVVCDPCGVDCRADEIASRLATAQSELQRAQAAVGEKEATLIVLQQKAQELNTKVQPTAQEVLDLQAQVSPAVMWALSVF